ncbi:MAG TPA: hypothetical protein VFQ23_25650 [Anaerolineales bacterium]|nr:hypothetical protein [Anaerolineales bacterium]
MIFDEMVYVGIEIASGSRPVIYACIDQEMNILLLENFSLPKVITHMRQNENIMLAVNASFRNNLASNENETLVFEILEKEITRAGFKPYLSNYACRQWVETYPLDCFDSLSEQKPLPRETTTGQVQRAEILHAQGLRLNAARNFFAQDQDSVVNRTGKAFYTPAELDALMAASIAWMLINRPVNIDLTRAPDQQMISIPREEKARWRKKPVFLR